ncbi:bifunctional 2',3'-cyclic-nucleotide 2'-phosphodiesterase/3'-nucleotidase [Paracoccus sp. ME4]|uniref:bifunctional 2',3'-cyclic-nucleotide 2'-phosphodiesterase/3'-nucleotidase n=1 Tax=Paracoccus sp. ME4 TaxID=3138066 RepID=UPI00398A5D28
MPDRNTMRPLDGDPAHPAPDGMVLRILATSDLHMHLLPYDYLANRPSDRIGLARTAGLIQARRAEAQACLLVDNGDILQGGPMGDLAARRAMPFAGTHPAIAAMNALGYDAAALGNHDFNFGLPFLRRTMAKARFPVLAANLTVHRGPGFAASCIVTRHLTAPDGTRLPLRVGVIGFLPPQTEEWDQDLRPQMRSDDILDCAAARVPRLRAQGADIIVALAHSGIGAPHAAPRMEHAAHALAALTDVDVVIAGHTHEVFPAPRWQGRPGIDALRGTLAGKPAVMPGYGGSHLGVIDLRFAWGADGRPTLAGFSARAEPVPADMPAAPLVARPIATAHRATLRQLSARVGRSGSALNSHFSVVGHDCGLRLVNLAQRWHVRQRLAGTAHAHLPVLSASAPYRAGGRGGPHHFTDVPAGTLTLRHLSDLYSFPNRITAIRITGAQLRGWLERSASLFNRVPAGSRDMPLLNRDFPVYNFDVIDGIGWRIDLSAPSRYHPDGRLACDRATRIRDLTWQTRPVTDDQEFVLATNSYRLASCGLFSPLVSRNTILLDRDALTQDVLRCYIRRQRQIRVPARPNWGFVTQPGSSVLFQTAPTALARPLPDPDRLQALGLDEDGFAVMRLML